MPKSRSPKEIPLAKEDRLPIRTKVAFGLGNAGEQFASVTVASYAMLYYNQVLGLPAHLAGLAMSASLLADGLSDPIAGGLSDRTRSRWGRRHPYMLLAPIAIVAAFLALWNPPSGLGQTPLFWWFLVSVSALRWSLSFYETPRMALGGELSPHYTERSNIMGYNQLMGFVGTFVVTWVALTYFFKATPEYPRGLLNPEPWAAYSLSMAVVMVIIMYGSSWFTRKRIPHLPKPPANLPKFTPFEFLKDLGRAIRNYNFALILVAFLCTSITIGMRNALHIYTNTFFWGLTSEELRFLLVGTFIGLIAAFVLAPRLHVWIDKKWTMVIFSTLYATLPSVPVWLGMAGIMQPGDPYVLPTIIVFGGLHSGVASISLISVLSVLADIADENDLKYGLRQEGVLYAMRSFFGKIDQAIGAAAAGFILTIIAFPVRADVGEIDPTTLWNLLLCDGVIAVIPGVIAGILYTQLRVNRSTYERTREALVERDRNLLQPDPDVSPLNEAGITLPPSR